MPGYNIFELEFLGNINFAKRVSDHYRVKMVYFFLLRVNIIRNISPHVQGFSFHIFWAYTGIEGFVQGFLYLMGVDIRTVRCSFQTSLWTALAGRIRLLCTKI